MAAVVEFVESAVETVSNVVSSVFETVGDVVESAVEFVGDVVEKVGDVVQKVIDDPLPVLLSIAGAAVGIPPYVTMGVITAAKGGDLEDVILSMGTAYVGSAITAGVGTSISSTVSSTFIESGLNETFSVVAGDAISKGLVNGTIAEIKGGSFEDGFAGGFTGGLVSGGVTEVASYVQPSVISLAMDSGLDLADATSVFNAGVKAVSAGATSEITGQGDFATSFANSAIGSVVDAGVRSVSTSIDNQFETAVTGWEEKSNEGEPISTIVTGAGIPDTLVTEVKVSDTGVDTSISTLDTSAVVADTTTGKTADTTGTTTNTAGTTETTTGTTTGTTGTTTGTADTTTGTTGTTTGTEDTIVSSLPIAETATDFQDLISTTGATSGDVVLADTATSLPSDVVDIANTYPEEDVVTGVPTGGLASVSETLQPINLSENKESEVVAPVSENLITSSPDETVPLGALASMSDMAQFLPTVETQEGAVLPDAAIAENLLINASTKDETEEQPIGGLNAVSTETPQEKIAPSLGIKATNITRPVISTIGSAIKSALNRKPTATRPVGGLARVKPKAVKPPARMDVAKLIPIQKAVPIKKTVGPAKTLSSTAKLSPVSNIANLTSLVKKAG